MLPLFQGSKQYIWYVTKFLTVCNWTVTIQQCTCMVSVYTMYLGFITLNQGWKLLCQYKFDIGSGSWQHNLLVSNSIESKRLKKKFEEPKWPQIFKESIKAFEMAEKAAKKLNVKDNQGRSYISFIVKGKKVVMIQYRGFFRGYQARYSEELKVQGK